MKRLLAILLIAAFPKILVGQGDTIPLPTTTIKLVVVEGLQSVESVGTQKTEIDTLAMRENVVNSLADILVQNTSIFIKSYGRGTLATASFRGTSASHTQVLWNGMRVNSPMFGMVDLSLMPSYFIDKASLYHGATSVGITGGGLGGAVVLGTTPMQQQGFDLRYVQGVGSFATYDEFLRLTYGSSRWQLSTRVYYGSSENDFQYTNYNKKEYIKDADGNIVERYYPRERNRNGELSDFHALQEAYYNAPNGDRWGVSAWYLNSHRGLGQLSVDRRAASLNQQTQHETTLRSVASWLRVRGSTNLEAKAGYAYTDFSYLYKGDNGQDDLQTMTDSRNYITTLFFNIEAQYTISRRWSFTATASAHQNMVDSRNKAIIDLEGQNQIIGYNRSRPELSAYVWVQYKPHERVGIALSGRGEWYGKGSPQFIPAAFGQLSLTRKGTLLLKSSIARNYRSPTLNDLYFMPGGNPDLRPERGFTYDGGVEFSKKWRSLKIKASGTLFDSYVDDWILWIMEPPHPTPTNIKQVRSYGTEFRGSVAWDLSRQWRLTTQGNYAITNSINRAVPYSTADVSIGKQLPYIPKYSGSVTGRLGWREWELIYKWQYYSERFTTSSNDTSSSIGRLLPYYMSDVSLERTINTKWVCLALKATVNNLFNEEYESVLSRPMAGRNYGLYLEITPRF